MNKWLFLIAFTITTLVQLYMLFELYRMKYADEWFYVWGLVKKDRVEKVEQMIKQLECGRN
jgi:hypothetical protein